MMKRKSYVILIVILLAVIAYPSYVLFQHVKAKRFLSKHEKLIGKFHCIKMPFVLFVENDKVNKKEFNVLCTSQDKEPIIVSDVVEKNYIGYQITKGKYSLGTGVKIKKGKAVAVIITCGDDYLFDYNADDIWDVKHVYGKTVSYYIFLNGKWVECEKNKLTKPYAVTRKSAKKTERGVEKHKELDGFKLYHSKSPYAIYVDKKLLPQKRFAVIYMQEGHPIITKSTINDKSLAHSISCDYFKTGMKCELRDDKKLKFLSISYPDREVFDFNGDYIWDLRKTSGPNEITEIFLNGKWIVCKKSEDKTPALTVTLKSGEKYFFSKEKGLWQKK